MLLDLDYPDTDLLFHMVEEQDTDSLIVEEKPIYEYL